MPSQEVLLSFREGLKVLQQANDFATLRVTIDRIVGVCPPDELHLAKDAIARVIRSKQAVEVNNYHGYPQAIEELDRKYRDLYVVLRSSQSKVPSQEKALPNSESATKANESNAQMTPIKGFGALNMPMMIIDWLKSKRKYILAGGAVGAVGGAYLLYKQLTSEKEESSSERESNFDKTIKSIQKYKAFTQMMNERDFSEYLDVSEGKGKKNKPKKREIIKEELKSNEWERDEKSLMRNMDEAFVSISTKPELDYRLPQLPAPKNVDPKKVLGEDKPLELTLSSDEPDQKRSIPEEKPRKVRRPRKTRRPRIKDIETAEITETVESEVQPERLERPRRKRVKKVKETSSDEPSSNPVSDPPDSEMGRLIPIVKRTKRVRKVNA